MDSPAFSQPTLLVSCPKVWLFGAFSQLNGVKRVQENPIFSAKVVDFFFSSDLDRSRCADHDGSVRFEKIAKPDFWGAKK
jgi:hypothetical protein